MLFVFFFGGDGGWGLEGRGSAQSQTLIFKYVTTAVVVGTVNLLLIHVIRVGVRMK